MKGAPRLAIEAKNRRGQRDAELTQMLRAQLAQTPFRTVRATQNDDTTRRLQDPLDGDGDAGWLERILSNQAALKQLFERADRALIEQLHLEPWADYLLENHVIKPADLDPARGG